MQDFINGFNDEQEKFEVKILWTIYFFVSQEDTLIYDFLRKYHMNPKKYYQHKF